jgi:hypothetical protein
LSIDFGNDQRQGTQTTNVDTVPRIVRDHISHNEGIFQRKVLILGRDRWSRRSDIIKAAEQVTAFQRFHPQTIGAT